MTGFIIRNIVQKLFTLFVISVLSFLILHLAPGDPAQIDPMNPAITSDVVERLRESFDLDKPLPVQYVLFYQRLFTGRLTSWKDGRPVLESIWERFLNSLPLFITGTLLTWTLAFPTGIRAAVKRGGKYDRTTTFIAYFLISIPGFFLAYILIIVVVNVLQVPVIGMRTHGLTGLPAVMNRVWHLVLPSVLSATAGIAILSRYVRSQMLEVESQDYIRTARAKGLSEDVVHYKHALRNAMMPFVTMFGMLLPGLIGGSVIIERIFAWPGMGRLAYDALLARDIPVILSLNFIGAILVVTGTLVSDILCAIVDPRVSYE